MGDLASCQLDTLVGSLIQQSAYTKRPKSFTFSYKANPQLGDEVLVGIPLTMTIENEVAVIGGGFFSSNELKENCIKKEVAIECYSKDTPDNINIIPVSRENAVINNGTNGYSKIRSTLYLDNIKLKSEDKIASGYFIAISPNPAQSHINIETNSPDHQQIEIYDLLGKLVFTSSFNEKARLDISNLPSGTSIYEVYNVISGETTATNKFNIIL